jgi:hypothetical protein
MKLFVTYLAHPTKYIRLPAYHFPKKCGRSKKQMWDLLDDFK